MTFYHFWTLNEIKCASWQKTFGGVVKITLNTSTESFWGTNFLQKSFFNHFLLLSKNFSTIWQIFFSAGWLKFLLRVQKNIVRNSFGKDTFLLFRNFTETKSALCPNFFRSVVKTAFNRTIGAFWGEAFFEKKIHFPSISNNEPNNFGKSTILGESIWMKFSLLSHHRTLREKNTDSCCQLSGGVVNIAFSASRWVFYEKRFVLKWHLFHPFRTLSEKFSAFEEKIFQQCCQKCKYDVSKIIWARMFFGKIAFPQFLGFKGINIRPFAGIFLLGCQNCNKLILGKSFGSCLTQERLFLFFSTLSENLSDIWQKLFGRVVRSVIYLSRRTI